jgi:signal peptidase I
MKDTLVLSDADVADELRRLAVAAAPAIHARPGLAHRALDRCKKERRQAVKRRAAMAAGAGLMMVVAAAASRPGGGRYFSVIQPSIAMRPTVEAGEQVIFHKRLHPHRGDVVYARVAVPGSDHRTISRVVAVAGDSIACPAGQTDRCSELVVNGEPVPEPYLDGMSIAPFTTVTVPADSLFVMGDARAAARDSRVYGPIRGEAVSGVAVRITGERGSRAVPGAPYHPAPHGGVDAADPPPEAPATTFTR